MNILTLIYLAPFVIWALLIISNRLFHLMTDAPADNMKTTMSTFAIATPLGALGVRASESFNSNVVFIFTIFIVGAFFLWVLAFMLENSSKSNEHIIRYSEMYNSKFSVNFFYILFGFFSAKLIDTISLVQELL